MKRTQRFAGLMMAAVLLIGGCGPAKSTTAGGPKSDPKPAKTAPLNQNSTPGGNNVIPLPTQPATQYPMEFKGSDGKSVTIAKEPQRILSLSPTFTETIYALGRGDRLVGRTDSCDYPAEVSKVPSVGPMMMPSVEKIAELNPDVILVSFMKAEVVAQIEKAGAKVIQIPSAQSIQGSYETMATLGKILNANEGAQTIRKAIEKDIQAVQEKVKNLPKKTVYYVAGFGKSGDYTAGANTFINDLIVAAGGDNVAKDVKGWKYSVEKLMEKDPEYLFIGNMAKLADEFKVTEPYKNLTAVKENRFLEVDDNLINREGPRMGKAVEMIAEILHPEAFGKKAAVLERRFAGLLVA
ncbi:Heme ABC transporter, cell surface heme and hemoprotein receptor HmuT [Clostridiaceae bacterium JG1575]|nr:Heme ABC transporter, cell surface heme and hemoprotein receptor HmuT [Clostridiaceae bacterium JG1575]